MALSSLFKRTNTVYFPGCFGYFKLKKIFELYKKIFLKLKINFKIIDEKICCGLPALEAGYEKEARRLARKNFELFKKNNIQKIITNCPEGYKCFSKDYSELIPDWDIKVENIWKLILDKIKAKPSLIKNKKYEEITYHDSCYLGRYCEIYDEPRKILELLGYKIKEFKNSREKSFCCGSCGGLSIVNKELSNSLAKERILQAKRRNIKKIIVCSLKNYILLKENSQDSDIEIIELSEVLAEAFNIKKNLSKKNNTKENSDIKGAENTENKENKNEAKLTLSPEEKILLETKANMNLEKEIKEEEFYYEEE